MRKLATLFLVAAGCFALAAIGIATADDDSKKKKGQQSPDSLVGCVAPPPPASGPAAPWEVHGLAVPARIDDSECVPFQGLSCSICILSLENQRCEVVDASVSAVTPAEGGIVGVSAFLLSCERP